MQARSTGLAPAAARTVAKDESDSFFTLRIPGALHDQIKLSAGTQHISLNSFIVRAVERAIEKKGQQQ
jgi:predicted HicB family RNase H-like nuclease